MTHNQYKAAKPKAQPGAARIRWLVVALAITAVACALIAFLADGDARVVFGGVALVFAIAAVLSTVAISTSGLNEPQFDLDAPPPVTPLPQSPVSETYEPGVPPYKSRERTREG